MIRDRLIQLREERGLKRAEAARALRFPYTTYVNYETGQREPAHNALAQIADYYDVSVDFLLGRTTARQYDLRPATMQKPTRRVPVLGRIPAGVPIEAIEDVIDWEDLGSGEYPETHEYFGLLVIGDSMSPKYLDGDTIIVQRAQDADSGKDVVAYVNGHDATLKRLLRSQAGTVTLAPLNPEYAQVTYTASEVDKTPVRVIGVVKEIRRKV